MAQIAASALKFSIAPILMPLTMTIVAMKVKAVQKFFENIFKIKISGSFKTKQDKSVFGLLFLIFFLLIQLFLLPFVPVGPSMGKFTSLTPLQVPGMLYKLLIFGALPLAISSFIVNVSNENNPQRVKQVKSFGIIVGFFFAVFIMQKVSALSLIIAFILFVLLSSKNMFNNILRPFGLDVPKAGLQSKQAQLNTSLLFLLVLGFVLTTFEYLPGYDKLSEMIDSKIGTFGTGLTGLANYGLNAGAFLLLPLVVGNSLETTSQKIKSLPVGQGFDYGYIIGILTGLLAYSSISPFISAIGARSKGASVAKAAF
jgi:hypothetical protein